MVENLPASAGHTGSKPGPGRSHMLQAKQLSLCATTIEPVLESLGTALLSPPTTASEPTCPGACARQQEKQPQWESMHHTYRIASACRN